MKICAISDTHSYHRKINMPMDKDIDTLIHAGDITWRGELDIIEDFSNWLKELPYKNKIVIFGNHSLGIQRGHKRERALDMIRNTGAHYLEDSGITIDGIDIYGSPATPFFHNWEWNYQRGKDIAAVWSRIPTSTNILVTHGPPYGILDEAPRDWGQFENVGCEDLLARIKELTNLKLHVFGHIHHAYGMKEIDGVKFVNASTCTEAYAPTNPPIVIEL